MSHWLRKQRDAPPEAGPGPTTAPALAQAQRAMSMARAHRRVSKDLNGLVISGENFSSEYNKPLQFQMPTHRSSMNRVPPAALASTSLCHSKGTKLLSQPISRSSPSIDSNYLFRAHGSAVSSPLTSQPWERDLLPITR